MNLHVFSPFFPKFSDIFGTVYLYKNLNGLLYVYFKQGFYRLTAIFLIVFSVQTSGQTIKQIPLNKPANFKDKILRSEKTEDVSLTLPRRLYHGMVSHYNYYYNAQVKLNTIVQKAQLAHQEDFTKLLPFFDYSVNVTSADSTELDSVMIKATAGIVLHDLRNSYVDDLLLLIGKSYYYWNKPDSSYRIFQYINYNFYPNKKDEFRITIGSAADAKDGKLTIGTKEKKGIITKTFSKPPARNEALLWIAKIYAEQDLHDEAVSLISILKKDPNFPKRLHPYLDEIMAYSFYNRETWDSAAFYLQKSLKTAETTAQLARKEFLLGQLYTLANKSTEASSFYQKAKTHTNDPVMHIHARLNNVLLTNTDSSNINQSLNDLLKLAKKERFDGYEDLLYYAASDVALQKKDTSLAYSLLQKSVRFAQKNPESSVRNNAFSKLGGLALKQKNYRLAASCYDSINLQDPQLQSKVFEIEKTKKFLTELVQQKDIVIKEDSLQRIAAMPEEEREAYLKTLLKRLRKEKGLKEESTNSSSGSVSSSGISSGNQGQDLFATGNNAGWYFNANNQKNKGPAEFKNKWGNRPNQDNWRRQSAIDASIANANQGMFGNPGGDGDIDNPRPINPVLNSGENDQELSIESLRYNLPLTDEKTASSNQSIYDALLSQGNILKNQLEDYEGASQVYMDLLRRFPQKDSTSQVLSELYYCLLKTGDQKTADMYRQSLEKAGLNEQKIKSIDTSKSASLNKELKAIATYEQIYRWYIEGEFSKARQNKIAADSLYGNHFWTPQLMYIEAVYFAHLRQDSAALLLLTDLLNRFGSNPIAEKAVILQDVLQRRTEIEQHLRESKIVRAEDPKILSNKKPDPDNNKKPDPVTNPATKKAEDNKKADKTDKPKTNTSLSDSSKSTIVSAPDKKTDLIQDKNQPDSTSSAAGNTKVTDKTIKNTDSCTLVIALINVYPVYKTECQTTIENYLRSNMLAGQTGITSSLNDGKGNYGWITINQPFSAAECEKSRLELKTILPKQLYFMPADKYKLLALDSSKLKQLELTEGIDDFIKIISQWIKD